MADISYNAPQAGSKPWNGNSAAQSQFWETLAAAHLAAVEGGASGLDLLMAHLEAAAGFKGVSVWDLVESLTPQEREAINERGA